MRQSTYPRTDRLVHHALLERLALVLKSHGLVRDAPCVGQRAKRGETKERESPARRVRKRSHDLRGGGDGARRGVEWWEAEVEELLDRNRDSW
jgi:hypothetical protein